MDGENRIKAISYSKLRLKLKISLAKILFHESLDFLIRDPLTVSRNYESLGHITVDHYHSLEFPFEE